MTNQIKKVNKQTKITSLNINRDILIDYKTVLVSKTVVSLNEENGESKEFKEFSD